MLPAANFPEIGQVLIETLWNVKILQWKQAWFVPIVLIETLWNVKFVFLLMQLVFWLVLIETLWNVKEVDLYPAQMKLKF